MTNLSQESSLLTTSVQSTSSKDLIQVLGVLGSLGLGAIWQNRLELGFRKAHGHGGSKAHQQDADSSDSHFFLDETLLRSGDGWQLFVWWHGNVIMMAWQRNHDGCHYGFHWDLVKNCVEVCVRWYSWVMIRELNTCNVFVKLRHWASSGWYFGSFPVWIRSSRNIQ